VEVRRIPKAAKAAQADVKRMASRLPAAEQPPDRLAFAVANKGKLKKFVWWMERVTPRSRACRGKRLL
jgi:hypothetical protein